MKVIEYYHKICGKNPDETIGFVVYNDYEDLLTNLNENNFSKVMIYIDDKFECGETIKLRRILKDKFLSGEKICFNLISHPQSQ